MGLFYHCKFISDQKILVSGQLNFFKAFVGIVNANDGTFLEAYAFESTDLKYKVGYAYYALDFGKISGDIYMSLSFLGSPVSMVRIQRAFNDSQGR